MIRKDIDAGKLMDLLMDKPEIPLKFYIDDISINPGYHVTEVKHASIKSMDCGKRSNAWDEILIQLLDGEAKSAQGFMSSSKFTSILSAALKTLTDKSTPYLFFEFSPGNGPLQKLKIKSVACKDKEISVQLSFEKAVCKPFERRGIAGAVSQKLLAKSKKDGCCIRSTPCCG